MSIDGLKIDEAVHLAGRGAQIADQWVQQLWMSPLCQVGGTLMRVF